ncbi:DUF3179 domain-containing protein [Oceanicola sp. D3]|uniref:DUF3179 domain-containing protein n=1 Tax=Oceanicola sp. D3 TaxID=2587163 RepID=UPI001124A7B0|nr:DUF3179 domain-containing protein [Oceanicola sp. D3]QDC09796.1 DUF3179 domain-containing protein [Oceanicola sp. D3]
MGFLLRAMAWLVLTAGVAMADPGFWKNEWPRTDFSKTSVENWVEILSGGPGKDGIPALTAPKFIAVSKAKLAAREPVITLEIAGKARAYPLRYLIWHEIVNDRFQGLPIAVTYCPLCNSALVYYRKNKRETLEFGVTGKLRNSDMIMYDRQTESWWQQATGKAIVGKLTGAQLSPLPSWMESWESFATRNPRGEVMAEPNHGRPYGTNPYERYDSSKKPFLFNGEMPPHGIPPLVRVVRVGQRAWPLPRIAKAGEIREAGVVINWTGLQASALDSGTIAKGRDVGMIRVRNEKGEDVAHDLLFAFAFHAFYPRGAWMLGKSD